METKNWEDILLDPDNPRDILEDEFEHLKASLQEFGDLGGFVFNRQTGQLVGGHQRKRAFDAMGGQKIVVIQNNYDAPDRVGTVATGFIEHDGITFAYREVDWDINRQRAANIAANRIGGVFNLDKLSENNYKLLEAGQEELLKLTGQSEKELSVLVQSTGANDPDSPDPDKAPAEPPRKLVIVCETDEQMTTLYQELKDRGLRVKLT